MPELPEVEVTRELLERWLVGRRILSALAPDARARGGTSRRELEAALAGAMTRGVERRGKFLLLDFGPKRRGVVAHLGMTGKFVRLGRGEPEPRFLRVSLALSRGERVGFVDARRLGQFRLRDAREERRLAALGLEPLSRELTAGRLHQMASRSRRPIKIFLMDQKRLAGIGNIQAAEALFLARIHPAREASSLRREEAAALARAIRSALRRELRSYRERPVLLSEGGDADFLVYGRAGEPCRRCGSPLSRFLQGGRSSYYCPRCQRKCPTWTGRS